MLTCIAAAAGLLEPGREYDLPPMEAKRLISAGFAVPVAGREIVTAILRPPEHREVRSYADCHQDAPGE